MVNDSLKCIQVIPWATRKDLNTPVNMRQENGMRNGIFNF